MKWQYKVLDLTEHSSDPAKIAEEVNKACAGHDGWKVLFIDNDQAWYRIWLARLVSH